MLPPLVMLLTDFSGLHSPACKAFARLAACRRAWYASFCCAESRCAGEYADGYRFGIAIEGSRDVEGRRPCQLYSLTS